MRPVFYATLISMIACSGADESSPIRMRGGETNGTSSSTNATQPKDDGEDTAPTTNNDQDPSTSQQPAPTTSDAGVDSGPKVDPNPFSGAPAYVNTLGPSARKTAHPFTNDNPAGRACFNCHGDLGNATPMAFGGTVYTTAGGTTGAARVEVRVKDRHRQLRLLREPEWRSQPPGSRGHSQCEGQQGHERHDCQRQLQRLPQREQRGTPRRPELMTEQERNSDGA